MLTDTRAWSPIKTDNGGTLPPMYVYRFNGPGYLYCRGCGRGIRLVYRTKTGVRCLDCGHILNIATPFKQVDSSLLRRETSCGTPDTPHLA